MPRLFRTFAAFLIALVTSVALFVEGERVEVDSLAPDHVPRVAVLVQSVDPAPPVSGALQNGDLRWERRDTCIHPQCAGGSRNMDAIHVEPG